MEEFEALYRRHASAVYRFAWGLCGDRSGAEDLVSETFVRVRTRAPKLLVIGGAILLVSAIAFMSLVFVMFFMVRN
jgi:hypothetical protein